MTIETGSKVWIVPNPNGTEHPAIVIYVSSDRKRALVICGTGTGPRDIEHELIECKTRTGKQIGLTKDTYFYATSIHVRSISELRADKGGMRCGAHLYNRLRELARRGAAQVLSQAECVSWWPPPVADAEIGVLRQSPP